jgi:hypothetical protein
MRVRCAPFIVVVMTDPGDLSGVLSDAFLAAEITRLQAMLTERKKKDAQAKSDAATKSDQGKHSGSKENGPISVKVVSMKDLEVDQKTVTEYAQRIISPALWKDTDGEKKEVFVVSWLVSSASHGSELEDVVREGQKLMALCKNNQRGILQVLAMIHDKNHVGIISEPMEMTLFDAIYGTVDPLKLPLTPGRGPVVELSVKAKLVLMHSLSHCVRSLHQKSLMHLDLNSSVYMVCLAPRRLHHAAWQHRTS